MKYLYINLIQHNEYLASTVGADDRVHQHKDISGESVKCALMRLQLFWG